MNTVWICVAKKLATATTSRDLRIRMPQTTGLSTTTRKALHLDIKSKPGRDSPSAAVSSTLPIATRSPLDGPNRI
jgi:hypothetical protein